MAEFLLQVADVRAGVVPGARPVHPVDEAEEYAAMDDGGGFDHAPRAGVLRLSQTGNLPVASSCVVYRSLPRTTEENIQRSSWGAQRGGAATKRAHTICRQSFVPGGTGW